MIAQIKRRGVQGVLIASCLVLVGVSAFAQDSLDKLVAAANSSDEAARITAIQQLGTQGPAAVGALTELLKSDSPAVRGYAAQSLATIGPAAKDAAKNLIDLLGDPHGVVRRHAIEALAAIRPGPKVSIPLFAKLMQDSDPGVQMRVMAAIADAKGAAVPAIIEALNNEATAYWACVILRDIGPDGKAAVPALIPKLKDPSSEIRREATLALAAIGSPDAVADIVPLLKDEPSRTAATFALATLGNVPPDAESVIRANVKSDDKMLSATSMWALARLHPKDMRLQQAVLEHLVALLANPDPFVRTAAARGLASLQPSPEIAGPIFAKAMAEADETTTHYMLDALASLGPPAVPRLMAALKFAPLRPQICGILGRIGPPAAPATDALAQLLSDPNPNVSIEAGHALAAIGPAAKAAVPALIEALKQDEGPSAHAAAYALGKIGPDAKAADTALVAIVRKSDDSLALLSSWALVKINGATATSASVVLPDLIAGLASQLPQSRIAAAEVLGELGPFAKSAAGQLKQATQDSDESVRAAAAKALQAVSG